MKNRTYVLHEICDLVTGKKFIFFICFSVPFFSFLWAVASYLLIYHKIFTLTFVSTISKKFLKIDFPEKLLLKIWKIVSLRSIFFTDVVWPRIAFKLIHPRPSGFGGPNLFSKLIAKLIRKLSYALNRLIVYNGLYSSDSCPLTKVIEVHNHCNNKIQ